MKTLITTLIAILIAINTSGTHTIKVNETAVITSTAESFTIEMNDETNTYSRAEFEKVEVQGRVISIYHNDLIDNYYIED